MSSEKTQEQQTPARRGGGRGRGCRRGNRRGRGEGEGPSSAANNGNPGRGRRRSQATNDEANENPANSAKKEEGHASGAINNRKNRGRGRGGRSRRSQKKTTNEGSANQQENANDATTTDSDGHGKPVSQPSKDKQENSSNNKQRRGRGRRKSQNQNNKKSGANEAAENTGEDDNRPSNPPPSASADENVKEALKPEQIPDANAETDDDSNRPESANMHHDENAAQVEAVGDKQQAAHIQDTEENHLLHETTEVDDDMEERRQAEVEFVASAYSPEEAWCDDTTKYPLRVHRRLSLPDPNNEDQNVSLILSLSMTKQYPETEPLEISFQVEKGPTHLWNAASDAAPILVEACRQVALEMVGDEAIFTVLSHADEWIQDHWPSYCQTARSPTNNNRQGSEGQQSTSNNKRGSSVLGRRLIYSHHIISKIKRGNMRDLASHYQLTGYVKIGWPGIILIEGAEEHCQFFYDDIKVWAWKYLVVRGEQQEKVGLGQSMDSLRKFTCFQETSDMSLVADHCRQVGLEALFKTSMKVYDNTTSSGQTSGTSSDLDSTPYGTLVWVDHMTDGKAYRKWLRKTSADTNVFLLIKQCFPNHDFTKRPTIVVAVVGEMESVQDFMKRWRTSRVDVDSRGKACLERKMKVLHEGDMQNEVIDAVDWESASADASLNMGKEQLVALITSLGNSEWLASAVSLLSVS